MLLLPQHCCAPAARPAAECAGQTKLQYSFRSQANAAMVAAARRNRATGPDKKHAMWITYNLAVRCCLLVTTAHLCC